MKQRLKNSGFSRRHDRIFKPAVLSHFRAAAHTGKSILKQSLLTHDPKRMITPVVNRTLHTYHNTLRILCEAFQIEFEGRDHHCERLLVQQAFSTSRPYYANVGKPEKPVEIKNPTNPVATL